jgi:hypothetical protein
MPDTSDDEQTNMIVDNMVALFEGQNATDGHIAELQDDLTPVVQRFLAKLRHHEDCPACNSENTEGLGGIISARDKQCNLCGLVWHFDKSKAKI